MLIVPIFYHIYTRSGTNIVAASGHVEVKNCTEIYLRRGRTGTPLEELTALPSPQTPYLVGIGFVAPPQELHPYRPFGPRFTICLPLEKNRWRFNVRAGGTVAPYFGLAPPVYSERNFLTTMNKLRQHRRHHHHHHHHHHHLHHHHHHHHYHHHHHHHRSATRPAAVTLVHIARQLANISIL